MFCVQFQPPGGGCQALSAGAGGGRGRRAGRGGSIAVAVAALVVALGGCVSSAPSQLPRPRPLINQAGARLVMESDDERMREVYGEVDLLLDVIINDPSFLIWTEPEARDVFPWETLEISADTARIRYRRSAPDLRNPYEIYAFLHLMREEGRVGAYLPAAEGLDGWRFEFEVMRLVADSWLLGRAYFDFAPYPPMDRVMYAAHAGYLPEFLLALRPGEFDEVRVALDPVRVLAFESWFRETFNDDPPPLGF